MAIPDLVERFRAARGEARWAVLEGFHPLKHALRFGAQLELAVAVDPPAVQRLAAELAPELAEGLGRRLEAVDPQLFSLLAPQPPHTEVMALAHRPEVALSELLAAGGPKAAGQTTGESATGEPATGGQTTGLPATAATAARSPSTSDPAPLVLLDEPVHLGNLGAAVRVAAAAGAAGLLATGVHDPWHPDALRGGAGLQFALPVARIEALPPCDRPLVAITPDGEPLRPGAIPPRAILAFGSERRGLGPELLARAEHRLALPMRPGVSSLNLATAVAAVLYAWRLGQAE